ncbi:MAG TPA: hypothetical protein VGE34_00960 [Candidatus Saccharimonadales bacterium]
MAVSVKDWLDKVVGDHQFSPKKTYGNQNGNIVLRLKRPLILESFMGREMRLGGAGMEVCIFRHYRSNGSETLATIFEPNRQVSILAGGVVRVRPYPSGTTE